MYVLSKEIITQISKLSSSRERYVIEMRLGINSDRPHTLQEIADKLELSRERIRQIQHRALLKLANGELNAMLLVSELTSPSPRKQFLETRKAKKRSNELIRLEANMNFSDQFIVVNFTIPVKGIDPIDNSQFFADRHRIKADWARQDGTETLFMFNGEVKYSWPTSVIEKITWPSVIDIPVTPKEFASRMEEIKSEFPKAWSKWSFEEEQKLSDLFLHGKKISDIARAMGRAPGGIYSRLRKMELIDDLVEFSDDLAITSQKVIVTDTVYELISSLYKITVSQHTSEKVNRKFNEPGWFLMVDKLFHCPTCSKMRILVMRKHWKNMGRVFHRWAIACLECDKIGESRDFDNELINSIHLELEEFPPVEATCPDCIAL